jgi:hypothetical protein
MDALLARMDTFGVSLLQLNWQSVLAGRRLAVACQVSSFNCSSQRRTSPTLHPDHQSVPRQCSSVQIAAAVKSALLESLTRSATRP